MGCALTEKDSPSLRRRIKDANPLIPDAVIAKYCDLTNVGFICGEGIEACGECGVAADYLCDFPMGRGKTCDAVLCDDHAHVIGDDRHLCPIHAAVFKATGALTPLKMTKMEIASET